MALVARWTALVIVFNCSGHGVGVAPDMPVVQGQRIGRLPDAPRRQNNTLGMRFVGWYRYDFSQDAGTRVEQGDIFDHDYSVHLFARWESNTDPIRHLHYWWPNNSIPLRNFEIPSNLDEFWGDDFGMPPNLTLLWETAMTQGMNNWNNSTAPVEFNVSTSGNRVRVRHVTSGDVFGSILFISLGSYNRFSIELCHVRILEHARNMEYTFSNVIESVMAHELAHAIGLADGEIPDRPTILGGFSNASLMNSHRSRDAIRGPQDFDITSVRMIYDD